MWITIPTTQKLGLSSTEREAYRNHSSVAADGDPLPEIIESVTEKVRNAIRSNPANRLDPDPTKIAKECLDAAICLIRYRLLSIIDDTVSDARTNEWKDANAFLIRVENGKAAIEQPDEDPAAPAPAPTPSPQVRGRKTKFSRCQQDGI